jgi:hypothetical protein
MSCTNREVPENEHIDYQIDHFACVASHRNFLRSWVCLLTRALLEKVLFLAFLSFEEIPRYNKGREQLSGYPRDLMLTN